ncbi:hypothetical protein V865_005879 [Kwoniella europaea PYCC6329]|uniref:Ubiquitin-like protease family profile domain-containing protein n=1 Tax=Kwoniella europaea PYCC6329 TaxID=1423913 RepID=A0AAX4KMP8_9TREE
MEGLGVRQTRQDPQRSPQVVFGDSHSEDEAIPVVTRTRRRNPSPPVDWDSPLPDSTGTPQASKDLPLEQMTALRRDLHKRSKDMRERKSEGRSAGTGSPFNPGMNRMDNRNVGISPTTKHNTQDVNRSRQQLAGPSSSITTSVTPSRQHQTRVALGRPQRVPAHLSQPPDASSTPRAGPSSNDKQISSPSKLRTPEEVIDFDTLESDEDHQVVPSSSRSASPHKPSSSDHRRASSTDYTHVAAQTYNLRSPQQPSSGKGKETMRGNGYHENSSPTKGSRSGLPLKPEPKLDPIRNPDGTFKADLIDKKIYEVLDDDDDPPDGTVQRQDQKHKSSNQWQMSVINNTINRSGEKIGRKPKLGRMQGKDGKVSLQQAQKSTPVKPTMKDRMTEPPDVIPSAFGHRNPPRPNTEQASADVTMAWLVPDRRLKVNAVQLKNESLIVSGVVGQSGEWWDINLSDISQANTCNAKDCPFMMLMVSTVRPLAESSIEKLLAAGGSANHQGIDASPSFCLSLKPGESSKTLIDALGVDLVHLEKKRNILDVRACETLRSSCNIQSRDTRSRADEARRQKQKAELQKEVEGPGLPSRGPRKSSAKDEESSRPPKSGSKDKAEDNSTQTKLVFPPAPKPQPRRSIRNTAKTVHDLEDSDTEQPENSIVARPSKPSRFIGDRNELLFPYPTTGRADVNITIGDAQRIETDDFLNDTLLEFGLRHVLFNLEEERRDQVHLFNSFFYERLSNKAKRPQKGETFWPGYESVKKWSKGKDIFGKEFVVIPINENYHWYLAVIINPSGILRPKPIEDDSISEMHQPTTRATASEHDGEDAANVDDQLRTADPPRVTDSDLEDLNSDAGDQPARHPTPGPSKPLSARLTRPPNSKEEEQERNNDISIISNDPLDCISNGDGDGEGERSDLRVSQVLNGVEKMDISSENGQEEEVDFVGGGAPILTSTMMAVQEQNNQIRNASQEPAGESQVKKTQARPDVQIIDSQDTWILTLDSLGGPHKAVGNQLNQWLKYEARDKKGIDYEPVDALYHEAKVPQQGNFSDCGLFVVHYAEKLLQNPKEVLKFVQRRPPFSNTPEREPWVNEMNKAWRKDDTEGLRNEWAGILGSLADHYKIIQGSKTDEKQSEDANLNPNQDQSTAMEGIIDTSQSESVTAIGASQFPPIASTSSTVPEDLIPGAFPTPTEPVVPTELEKSASLTPPPPMSRVASNTSKKGPSWATRSPTPDIGSRRDRSRSRTGSIAPELRGRELSATSTTRSSRSPEKNIPVRHFPPNPSRTAKTPGRSSIEVGTVHQRVTQYEQTERSSTIDNRVRSRESEENEIRLREVEHLRPKRTPLQEILETTPASSSRVAATLSFAFSESEDKDHEVLAGMDDDSVEASPLANLGKGAPRQSSPRRSVNPLASSPLNATSRNGNTDTSDNERMTVDMEGISNEEEEEEEIEEDKNFFTKFSGSHQRSDEGITTPASNASTEENEPIENLFPKNKSPVVRHKYGKNGKNKSVSQDQVNPPSKRTRSTSNNAISGSISKKNKKDDGNDKGDGRTKEEAITIDSD